MNETSTGELLMNRNCPYNFQCKAVDCLECIEIHRREKEEDHGE